MEVKNGKPFSKKHLNTPDRDCITVSPSSAVPGLAENRPSVLRGDTIYVEILGDKNHLRYEGIVHRVRENDVHLGFHKNFITKYVKGMQLRVQFTFNRLPLRVQHRALSLLRRCEVQKLMFPSICRGLFGVSPITLVCT
uniref:Helicase MOV-10-like beta-barrel domain-containing protein n=1 Tax=Timema bartmani TaxID=61472 RepID=A0A7R9FEN8_9NEOP|nr:unnamed protein product [Timema bartmani]